MNIYCYYKRNLIKKIVVCWIFRQLCNNI